MRDRAQQRQGKKAVEATVEKEGGGCFMNLGDERGERQHDGFEDADPSGDAGRGAEQASGHIGRQEGHEVSRMGSRQQHEQGQSGEQPVAHARRETQTSLPSVQHLPPGVAQPAGGPGDRATNQRAAGVIRTAAASRDAHAGP